MVRAAVTVSLLVAALGIAAAQDGPPRKKLIATGWDMATPERLRENLALMEERPFDGVTIRFAGRGNQPNFSYAFSGDAWDAGPIDEIIEDLQACTPTRLTDNFLVVNANPGDVDWFDDGGWAAIVDHWRTAARVAKEGGLKGILFDPEPYTAPYSQFGYLAQPQRDQHEFPEYCAKARQRGREAMAAIAEEYPDITIYGYFLLSVDALAADRADPLQALSGSGYGLLPSFVDGWLDAAPETITFVDGCESAYRFNSELEYLNAANRIRGICQRLVSPENRYKYRAQVQASFGIYLDAYINPPDSTWYIDPGDQTPAGRLRQNVETALRVADEYVWVYGEQCSWWPTPHPKANERRWPDALPGIEDALSSAADPLAYAERKLAEAGDDVANVLLNGVFSLERVMTEDGRTIEWTEGKPPAGWSFWQSQESTGQVTWDRGEGADEPGSVRMSGVAEGCALQSVPASPGERYAVIAQRRLAGEGDAAIRVRWQEADGTWYAPTLDRFLDASGPRDEWGRIAGVVTVPEGAGRLVVLLRAAGQESPEDVVWYDDVVVFKVG